MKLKIMGVSFYKLHFRLFNAVFFIFFLIHTTTFFQTMDCIDDLELNIGRHKKFRIRFLILKRNAKCFFNHAMQFFWKMGSRYWYMMMCMKRSMVITLLQSNIEELLLRYKI